MSKYMPIDTPKINSQCARVIVIVNNYFLLEMSPKNTVSQLSFLCEKHLSNVLIHALSDDEGQHYEVVNNYLRDATTEIVQDLLKMILNTENLDASTRFSSLEVLLREDVRRLDTGVFPNTYYEKILKTLTVKCKQLQHLNLKGVWVREHANLLSKALQKLTDLKVVIMPHIPDDSVLETAIKYNKLIILDISGECSFTEHGLMNLKSDSLKILHIGMFGKKQICQEEDSPGLVAAIIRQLPNLHVLKVYSFTGSALLRIYEDDSQFLTKLTYIHDTDTTPEIFKSIVQLCPKLESANFNNPHENVLKDLHKLPQFIGLKLSKPSHSDFMNYLLSSGNGLHVLKLNLVKDRTIDLSSICINAPELQILECFKLNLTYLQPETYFMNLQIIEILYCDISNGILKYLLMNTPFLKRIVVGDTITMTDGDIFRLCAECEFMSLEELWFSSARGLTAISVELLMGHCPNLRVLGQLNGWDITSNDMDYLRAFILLNNIDLILLPVGVFP